jgi:hypothetical protein
MVLALSIIFIAIAVRAEEPVSSDKLSLDTFEKIYSSGYDAGYNQGVIDMLNEISGQETSEEDTDDPEVTEDSWKEMFPEIQSESVPIPL